MAADSAEPAAGICCCLMSRSWVASASLRRWRSARCEACVAFMDRLSRSKPAARSSSAARARNLGVVGCAVRVQGPSLLGERPLEEVEVGEA